MELKGVCFKYSKELVLKDVSVRITPGEITAVIGPNGSGKSTLLKCMAGILKPNRGKVLLNGNSVGYVPQDHFIGAVLTVFEVVLLGRIDYLSWKVDDKDLEITLKVLEDLKISHLASKYINELSGGQRQIVFIAQALVKDPQILLMDEPVSNLDIRHQLEILKLIKRITLKNKITTVVVLHDLNLALRYADKILVLNDGEVKAYGTPQSVLTSDLLKHIYGVEAIISKNKGIMHVIPVEPLEENLAVL